MSLHGGDEKFNKALDLSWMRQALEQILRKTNPSIIVDTCEIADVKYEIGRPFLILYQAMLRDGVIKMRWKQFFSARLLSEEEVISPSLPLGAFILDSPKSYIFIYPCDPVLTWLPQLCDENFLLEKIKHHVKHHLSLEKVKVLSIDMTLLAYTPSMRATHEMVIKVKRKGATHSENWNWISKTSSYKQPEHVYPNYVALWRAGKGKVPMPEPKGCLFDPPVTFQEKVKGIRLGALVDRPDFEDLMKNLGGILARFHGLEVPLMRGRSLENEIRSLDRWSGMLIQLCPEWKKRVEPLRLKMVTELENRFSAYAPIHADFHHTNILVHENEIMIIDMDEVAFGDPALDVGRFMSSLRVPSLRTFGSFEGLGNAREIFLENYLSESKAKVEDIRLFESISLLTSAASCLRFQRPDWKKEADLLLGESEAIFRLAKKGAVSLTRVSPLILPVEKRIFWATDEGYLKTVLAPFLHQKMGAEFISCQIRKVHRKGAHIQVEVKVKGMVKGQKERFVLGIIMHQEKKVREQFYFLRHVHNEMQMQGSDSLFPVPLGYIDSLEAVVVELKENRFLMEKGSFEVFATLGRSLALFHAVVPLGKETNKGSYVLKFSNPLKRIRYGEVPKVSFPFRVKKGNPVEDTSRIMALCFQKHPDLKEELTCFLKSYAEAAGIDERAIYTERDSNFGF